MKNSYWGVNPTIKGGERTRKGDQTLTEPYPYLTEGSSVLLTIIAWNKAGRLIIVTIMKPWSPGRSLILPKLINTLE